MQQLYKISLIVKIVFNTAFRKDWDVVTCLIAMCLESINVKMVQFVLLFRAHLNIKNGREMGGDRNRDGRGKKLKNK